MLAKNNSSNVFCGVQPEYVAGYFTRSGSGIYKWYESVTARKKNRKKDEI